MTVVMAMWDGDDSILVGTDSQATDEDGVKTEYRKIRPVALGIPVIWSSAGNPAIGASRFPQWLASFNFKNTNWPRFAEEASKVWSRLNGEQRERCKLAGITVDVNSEQKYLSDGLLVGWLHGKPAMYCLSNDGNLAPYTQEQLFAIGSGAPVAKAVFLSMFYVQEIKDRLAVLKTALITACNFAPNCGFPMEIWRLKSDGARQIEKATIRIVFEGQSGQGSNAT